MSPSGNLLDSCPPLSLALSLPSVLSSSSLSPASSSILFYHLFLIAFSSLSHCHSRVFLFLSAPWIPVFCAIVRLLFVPEPYLARLHISTSTTPQPPPPLPLAAAYDSIFKIRNGCPGRCAVPWVGLDLELQLVPTTTPQHHLSRASEPHHISLLLIVCTVSGVSPLPELSTSISPTTIATFHTTCRTA